MSFKGISGLLLTRLRVSQVVVENRKNKKNFPPSRTSWPEELFCPSCDGVKLPMHFLAVSTINDDLKCCH